MFINYSLRVLYLYVHYRNDQMQVLRALFRRLSSVVIAKFARLLFGVLKFR